MTIQTLWRWLFGPRDVYITDWHKRLIPEEEVEPTRSKTERERLEEHIERLMQIPRES